MIDATFKLDTVVLQPTSLCNLNCSYCYLPGKEANRRMAPGLTARLAQDLSQVATPDRPVEILWHCGEPLTCGLQHFKRLIEPFAALNQAGAIYHAIQTNATLINEEWCRFFTSHNFSVGVSLDGPEWANGQRVNWGKRPAFPAIMRGIEHLQKAGIKFGVIAVVSKENLDKAAELYTFFASLGCNTLSINIEEELGVHHTSWEGQAEQVKQFWRDLFAAWKQNPAIHVREFYYYLKWLKSGVGQTDTRIVGKPRLALLPTIGWNGDIVFLSPEFLGNKSEKYHDFVVGNLDQTAFSELCQQAQQVAYVQDFLLGKLACRDSCPLYSLCRGGIAANKYFETGSTRATQTGFCRNTQLLLAEALGNPLAGVA